MNGGRNVANIQRESKQNPAVFRQFSKTVGNFYYYFYSIISNFDGVMPYQARPPIEFFYISLELDFSVCLLSK